MSDGTNEDGRGDGYPDRTAEPVCPYCGHVYTDAWEINFGPGLEGDTTLSCGSCGRDYQCSREVDVYYRAFAAGDED